MTEPETEDGYPTDSTLEAIVKWPHTDFRGLMEFVRKAWHFGEWGWSQMDDDTDKCRRYSISTGGWSGNEDLIGALQDNRMFWMLCWQQSRRGGHYIFEVKL